MIRCAFARALAVSLLILAISPFTAPFSTCDPAALAAPGTPAEGSAIKISSPNQPLYVDVPSGLARFAATATLLDGGASPALDCDAIPHSLIVLRI